MPNDQDIVQELEYHITGKAYEGGFNTEQTRKDNKLRNDIDTAFYKDKPLPFDIKFLNGLPHGVEIRMMLMDDPDQILPMINEIYSKIIELDFEKKIEARARIIGLEDDPYAMQTGEMSWKRKIRNLTTKDENKLVVIEGIIKSFTPRHGQVDGQEYRCDACDNRIVMKKTKGKMPAPKLLCKCKLPKQKWFKVKGAHTYADYMSMRIEEQTESMTDVTQPQSIIVEATYDLASPYMANQYKPGAKVKVIGIPRLMPLRNNPDANLCAIYIEANNICVIGNEYENIDITPDEEKKIKELAQKNDIVDEYAKDVFHSIYGHECIKKALVCQMFGAPKIKTKNPSVRGDIHILLIGDPATAKSQMLRIVQQNALKARFVTATGSSGVGITASVERDDMTGMWCVVPGALPLMHRGIFCCDEFSRMDEYDLGQMHSAMEEQTISVDKASVHTTMVCETAILASCNPENERFNVYNEYWKQFNLTPALLSRFDCIFILRDIVDNEKDTFIAQTKLYTAQTESELLTLFRKHLFLAKKINPNISPELNEKMKKWYVNLRKASQTANTMAITARQLDAITRLTLAHARAKLKPIADEADFVYAQNLIMDGLKEISVALEITPDEITNILEGTPTKKVLQQTQDTKSFINHTLSECESSYGMEIELLWEKVKEAFPEYPESEFEKYIGKAKLQGDLYEPKRGFLKIAGDSITKKNTRSNQNV